MNLTVNKMSVEKAESQIKLLIGKYAAIMVESKQLNNEYMSPWVLAELDAANKVQLVFEPLAADIKERMKAK